MLNSHSSTRTLDRMACPSTEITIPRKSNRFRLNDQSLWASKRFTKRLTRKCGKMQQTMETRKAGQESFLGDIDDDRKYDRLHVKDMQCL